MKTHCRVLAVLGISASAVIFVVANHPDVRELYRSIGIFIGFLAMMYGVVMLCLSFIPEDKPTDKVVEIRLVPWGEAEDLLARGGWRLHTEREDGNHLFGQVWLERFEPLEGK